jgi:hypothetical protein
MTDRYILPFLFDYVFPNYILPNALLPELGIINYLHTIHSNKYRYNTFFEEPIGDQMPINAIFDKSLGMWPNSTRHNGSHFACGSYNDCLDYREGSIYFNKDQSPKYLYLIKINPHIDEFIGVDVGVGSRLNGEYFWKHMSAEALKDAQEGRAIIFLDYAQENFIERISYIRLHDTLRWSGIPKENIILAFNSFNAQEVYESWFPENERKIQVRNWPYVMANSSQHYVVHHSQSLNEEDFLSTRDTIRPNQFLFKIKRTRPHRLILLEKMATDGILDRADWSCLSEIPYNEGTIQGNANRFRINVNLETVKTLYETLPHSLQNEPGSTDATVSAWSDLNADAHKNSYLYVCTETYIHGEYKSLTEKVFKPISNYQPFVFVAWPGALKLLRELGFKTFDGFINESYDDEQDESIRMQMIYNEIHRISSMSKEDIHAWFWSMQDILLHNHNHLLTIHKTEPKARELIKYLHERVWT